ncbi:MAG TPA: hypothetical protein VG961_02925 [Ignavibacteria bacterium]|nr:hypothetical protein [Ignavibacteria bacterium]
MDTKQAELEISVIKKIMEDSRSAVYNKSSQGLFWFTLTSSAVMINYLMAVTGIGLKYSGILWIAVTVFGTAYSLFLARKENRNNRVKTFASKILTAIGISVGVSNILFAFASIAANAYEPFVIVSMNALILGMAFYILGVIQQLKSFKILADLWWAGSVFFFFMPGIHSLLFMAIMLAASAWIPWAEEKKQTKTI